MDKIPKNIGAKANKAGRPKGSLNKTTTVCKDAIAMAADKLGGTERLAAWAKEDPLNERAFWSTIYPKLLPLQMAHSGELTHLTKEQRDASWAAAQRADT